MQSHKKYFQDEGDFQCNLKRSRGNAQTGSCFDQGVRKSVDAGIRWANVRKIDQSGEGIQRQIAATRKFLGGKT